MMNNMMNRMMANCDKATILIEKKIDVGLGIREKLQLVFHTSMCDACTNYQKQSELVHKVLKKNLTKTDSTEYSALPQLKASILRRLKME